MAATNEIQSKLEELLLSCGGDAKVLTAAVRKVATSDAATSRLAKAMDEIASHDEFKKIALKRFKAEAVAAWGRAHPEGEPSKPLSGYATFLKETMPVVRKEFPSLVHKDLMEIVSKRWNAKKASSMSCSTATGLGKDGEDTAASKGMPEEPPMPAVPEEAAVAEEPPAPQDPPKRTRAAPRRASEVPAPTRASKRIRGGAATAN